MTRTFGSFKGSFKGIYMMMASGSLQVFFFFTGSGLGLGFRVSALESYIRCQ